MRRSPPGSGSWRAATRNGDIAEELSISRRTVQNHVRNILVKLQLRKRYELMRHAIERGLDRR